MSTPSTTKASDALRQAFLHDVLQGLACAPKSIPAKYIYDARGSELFEQITELDEYYLTRTERGIFEQYLPAMAEVIGPNATIIEPGAGSGEKAERLLHGLNEPEVYVPIEISHAVLRTAVERIDDAFPNVLTQPVVGDFTEPGAAQLPTPVRECDKGSAELLKRDHVQRRVVFFPGSTIGNFEAQDRVRLWRSFADLVFPGGMVLIGFDLVKSLDILLPAYNDQRGVSCEFNTNVLRRINRELAGDFNIDQFNYRAEWNPQLECIEMCQTSGDDQNVHVAGQSFHFTKGERLRTERSHKFTVERMDEEAHIGGFQRINNWTDDKGWFGVGLYQKSH